MTVPAPTQGTVDGGVRDDLFHPIGVVSSIYSYRIETRVFAKPGTTHINGVPPVFSEHGGRRNNLTDICTVVLV